jgi:hypothetical protein
MPLQSAIAYPIPGGTYLIISITLFHYDIDKFSLKTTTIFLLICGPILLRVRNIGLTFSGRRLSQTRTDSKLKAQTGQ